MLKPQKEFPLLERYKKVFPIDNKTIFAYNGYIYTDYDLPPDIIIHEIEHLKQQEQYGLENWVDKYLTDQQFRLEMELGAYIAQLKSIKNREFKNVVRLESAKTLSGELYGNLITFEEALKLLRIGMNK
jgi:hypothetical protein